LIYPVVSYLGIFQSTPRKTPRDLFCVAGGSQLLFQCGVRACAERGDSFLS